MITEGCPWGKKFSCRSCRDLNRWPFDYVSSALTIELFLLPATKWLAPWLGSWSKDHWGPDCPWPWRCWWARASIWQCLFHKRSLWCLSSASFTRDHTITVEIVMSFMCLFHKRSYNYSWDCDVFQVPLSQEIIQLLLRWTPGTDSEWHRHQLQDPDT